eukprot:5325045-Pyramimonas_sp.AAC.2
MAAKKGNRLHCRKFRTWRWETPLCKLFNESSGPWTTAARRQPSMEQYAGRSCPPQLQRIATSRKRSVRIMKYWTGVVQGSSRGRQTDCAAS